ncbi:potassium channel family protein [Azotosporobacter soli]|uniref:ion transporter n=1 Tax=Azotosporobacter soli TaxID=3055040 RepID=UPI0031FF3173
MSFLFSETQKGGKKESGGNGWNEEFRRINHLKRCLIGDETKLNSFLCFLEKYRLPYDLFMAALACVIITSMFAQNRIELSEQELLLLKRADFVILLIFTVDYIVRLLLAKGKITFVRENIIDLISIIPFDMMFQGLRAVRLLRVLYMLRLFVYTTRLFKRITVVIKTNDFHHIIWFTASTIFFGAVAISYIEDMAIDDALWWSFVTTTTVGYGDIAPQSGAGRLVAVCLMLIGIGFLSTLTGTVATYFLSQTKKTYKHEAVQNAIERLHDFNSLSASDLREMSAVLIALKENEMEGEGQYKNR